jgi:hypothetical protein
MTRGWKEPLLWALAVPILAACAATDETAPAGMRTFRDEYDGSTIVRQAPVGAGSSSTESWSALGFEWRSKFPDRVVVTAGTKGVVKIDAVAFDVDGEPVTGLKAVSEFTDHGDPGAGERVSTRRFEMSWTEFVRMASAKSVRMRLVGASEILVTSFGATHYGAPVNAALPPFVASVRKLRGEAPL